MQRGAVSAELLQGLAVDYGNLGIGQGDGCSGSRLLLDDSKVAKKLAWLNQDLRFQPAVVTVNTNCHAPAEKKAGIAGGSLRKSTSRSSSCRICANSRPICSSTSACSRSWPGYLRIS